jgi:hypothetical protein
MRQETRMLAEVVPDAGRRHVDAREYAIFVMTLIVTARPAVWERVHLAPAKSGSTDKAWHFWRRSGCRDRPSAAKVTGRRLFPGLEEVGEKAALPEAASNVTAADLFADRAGAVFL